MQRRTFLKSSIAAAAGWALAGPLDTFAQLPDAQSNFSLSLVTDQPQRAIEAVSRWIAFAHPKAQVRFAERRLPGHHVADLAWFHQGHLIDYRSAAGPHAEALAHVAHSLALPRPVEAPVYLKFESGPSHSQPTEAHVMQGDLLVERLNLAQNQPAVVINGTYGRLTLAIKDRAVSVVDASCKHKTCMKLGPIRTAGASLVCIPARLTVTLNGIRPANIDALTQ